VFESTRRPQESPSASGKVYRPDVTYLTNPYQVHNVSCVNMKSNVPDPAIGTGSIGARVGESEIRRPAPSQITNFVFALTTFLSAFLLFQVQLLVSKHILPWFGGTAAVWTTCMLVFQLLLLGGYIYSHKLSTRLSIRGQVLVHIAVLGCASLLVVALALLWPSAVTPSTTWRPSENLHPAIRVAEIILIATGLPFFVLSTTGPLLQKWFAHVAGGGHVYRLYAVSNAGSLLGLLSFPFLLEPTFRLTTLGKVWSLLFVCFAAGCATCAWSVRRTSVHAGLAPRDVQVVSHNHGFARRVLWFLLAATASALLLATTNLLCQEVVSIPLLWVLPLSIYLLSFILCFEHSRWYARALFHPAFALSVVAMWISMSSGQFMVQVVSVTAAIFCGCMICHGELARLKPGVEVLTSFYLTISLGGAVGGIFVAVVAPLAFNSFIEFPICLVGVIVLGLDCLVRDSESWLFDHRFILPVGILCGILITAYAGGLWIKVLSTYLLAIRLYPVLFLVGLASLIGSYVAGRPGVPRKPGFRFSQLLVGFVIIVLAAAIYQTTFPSVKLVTSRRNFYGVNQVQRSSTGKILMHGKTMHGAQLDPPYDHIPVTYYGPDSGVGIVLDRLPKRVAGSPIRLGVVGLGVGALAAYGQQGDYIRYYELDPNVVEFSRGERPIFTFLRDSQGKVDIALGDARLVLESELAQGKRQKFDVLALDAFSGDAIPVHLLTKEAFDTYWQQIDPESGIIAVHISSRHVDLLPIIYGLAKQYQAPIVISSNETRDPFLRSIWVVFARNPDTLAIPGLGQIILPDQIPTKAQLWTDDRSDVFRLLK